MSIVVLETVTAAREYALGQWRSGKTIGLVPTMGALHRGHARLMEVARSECDVVVVSIFVNPLQFDRKDDLDRYPRTFDADLALCSSLHVDGVFAPPPEEMYPRMQACVVEVRRLTEHLCGAHRPGHFQGVATVVLKLFQVVQPSRAYFGEKDAQQLQIIRRMVEDLNQPTTIVGVPTVREPDGLALSSRNRHLSPADRAQATSLSKALTVASDQIHNGERRADVIARLASAVIPDSPNVRLEYLQLVDPDELQPVQNVTGRVLVAGAMWVGTTRLIDNIVVTP